MSTAAEFFAVISDGNHSYFIAVFFSEESCSAFLRSVFNGFDFRRHIDEHADLLIDARFYRCDLFRRHSLESLVQQMGRCMVGSSLVSARDQHLTLCFFSCFQGAAGHFYFMDEYIICLGHIDDLSFTVSSPDHTGISSLTTAFCVERCFIQDHAACLALACCICIAFCTNDRFDEACIKQRFVSGEVCLAFHGKLCIYFIPTCIIHFLFRLGTLFLFFHSLFEAVQVRILCLRYPAE